MQSWISGKRGVVVKILFTVSLDHSAVDHHELSTSEDSAGNVEVENWADGGVQQLVKNLEH